MDIYSKLSIKSSEISTLYNFDKNGWESFIKNNKLYYMDSQRFATKCSRFSRDFVFIWMDN